MEHAIPIFAGQRREHLVARGEKVCDITPIPSAEYKTPATRPASPVRFDNPKDQTVGYGESKPKDASAPINPVNRRVQVVNMDTKTASK